jgi:hypothetical protein
MQGMDLDLRLRIAALDGWTEVKRLGENLLSGRRFQKTKDATADWFKIPEYEISFDAIAEACDRHNVGFDLEGSVDDKEGHKYSASYSGSDIATVGGIGFTRAIAVCHLFVAVMTERSREKERTMERDRYAKSFNLRKKVSILAGRGDELIAEEDLPAIIRLLLERNIQFEQFRQGLWGDPAAAHRGTGMRGGDPLAART